VTVSLPGGAALETQDPRPPISVAVHSAVDSAVKETVPDGVGPPLVPLTVAA
jgi:hypothetical protein